jgi:S1-C subfamily serine protease
MSHRTHRTSLAAHFLKLLPLAALLAWCQAHTAVAAPHHEQRALVEKMEAATVWVLASTPRGGTSMGSGFSVADGLILTNAHVVGNSRNAEVLILNAKQPPTSAKVEAIARNDSKSAGGPDFALLRYSPAKGARLPVLRFETEAFRLDPVSAWGYPAMVIRFDKSLTELAEYGELSAPPVVSTEGSISAFINDGGQSIVHSAAISGGNSGGPLVNKEGDVLGINTWGYSETGEGAAVFASLATAQILEFLQANGVAPLMAEKRLSFPPLAPVKRGEARVAAHLVETNGDDVAVALQILAPGKRLQAVRLDNLGGVSSLWRSDGKDGAMPLTVKNGEEILSSGQSVMSVSIGEEERLFMLHLADNGVFSGRNNDLRLTLFFAGDPTRAMCRLDLIK